MPLHTENDVRVRFGAWDALCVAGTWLADTRSLDESSASWWSSLFVITSLVFWLAFHVKKPKTPITPKPATRHTIHIVVSSLFDGSGFSQPNGQAVAGGTGTAGHSSPSVPSPVSHCLATGPAGSSADREPSSCALAASKAKARSNAQSALQPIIALQSSRRLGRRGMRYLGAGCSWNRSLHG